MSVDPNRWAVAGATSARFTTTHWSTVLSARDTGTPRAAQALESLCHAYWRPLYAFVRRRGYAPAEAQDLTQEFFARLLEKDYLRVVDPGKGKFRSFLLAALEHFLANEWRRNHARKRGGDFCFASLDQLSPEEYYRDFRGSNIEPERLFEQQWAVAMLEQVLRRLQDEFSAAGKKELFEQLKIFLTGEKRAASHAALAAELGQTEAGLKMAVSRMRRRYGELLREEIASTVSTPEEVEQELRALFAALSS